ncbi:hypothetical protein NDA11_004926 [Ustilago hordei]|nr:hypothetical protein NDA10_002950 [Ustilago hordei]KAJ1571135.1 hypothetical protein NDA12_000572 [Ustilago hordei]KAJ1571412.1 hypothetical protein NDA15_001400 [Ustilago hordei]KAJ1596092.1 hypothetical protein NDA11_004926 [Ustilago hordei]KAJ1596809.1 hypothetical protein NDA14_007876 [Ustilago hordei]
MPATPKSTPKKATASANGTPAASPSAAGTPSRMTRAQARATGIKIKTPSPLKKGGSTPKASSKKAAATASAEEEEESPSKSKAKSITTTPTKSSSSPSKSSPKKSPSHSKAASVSPSKLPASHAKLTRKPTSALATAEPIVAEYSEQEEEVEEDEKVEEDEDDEDEESDLEEGQDVSEKGMQRLMAALGEDGLDEVDMAALDELAGDEEDEDDEDVEKEDAEGEVSEGEVSEDEDKDEEEQPEDGDIPPVVASANGDTLAASIARSGLVPAEESDDEEDEEAKEAEEAEEEGDVEDDAENAIAYEDLPDDVELSEQAKASRVQRIKVNNESALKRIYEDIRLDAPSSSSSSKLPWIETMRVTYPTSISAEVTDVENDLERELAFYKQALHAAVEGRKLVEASGTAFSRPCDYFAEMVKTDEHMERIRQKLLDESAAIKASEAAKKQRELKKFGKKVQVEKLQERIRNKKEMNERVNGLKRKLGGGVGDDDGEEFDVRLEEAIGERASKKQVNGKGGRESTNKAKMPRSARDAKYGFGGKKKYSKSNTAESTNDFSVGPTRGARGSKPLKGKPTSGKAGFRPKQKSGAAKRPGKARRAGH